MLAPILKTSTRVQVCLKQLTLSHILFSILIIAASFRTLMGSHLTIFNIDEGCVPLLSSLLMRILIWA